MAAFTALAVAGSAMAGVRSQQKAMREAARVREEQRRELKAAELKSAEMERQSKLDSEARKRDLARRALTGGRRSTFASDDSTQSLGS